MSRRKKDQKSQPLTSNERAFVVELTRTDENRPRTRLEAFSRAYPGNTGKRTSKSVDASRVYARKHVQDAIAAVESRIEAERRRASRGNAQAIQTKLWGVVENATRDADVIAACKVLVTLLPKGAIDADPSKDSAHSKDELVERLKELLDDNLPDVLDVTPIGDGDDVDDESETDIEVMEIEAELLSVDED